MMKIFKPLHILVTDLNHNVQNLLKREFIKEGYCVYTAQNSDEIKYYIYGPDPLDIIILDPELCDFYGHSLFEKIQDRIPPVQTIVHTYKEFSSKLIKNLCEDDYAYIHFVDKNAGSVAPLKEKIIEIADKYLSPPRV